MTGRFGTPQHRKAKKMKNIRYFELERKEVQAIQMPGGAELISAGIQRGKIVVWALVDEIYTNAERKFRIAESEASVQEDFFKHIDTIFTGDFAWHVFDLGEVQEPL